VTGPTGNIFAALGFRPAGELLAEAFIINFFIIRTDPGPSEIE
jgi:hypothetical protein